jgi:hypothetical protein
MLRKLSLSLIALSLIVLPAAAGDDIEQRLLSVIPDSVNTLTVVRMRTLMKSPLAIREGWAQKNEADYLNGAVVIPPWSDIVVIGTKLSLDNPLHSPSTAIIDVGKEWDVGDLAKRERGVVTTAGGDYVVLSSRRAFFVPHENYMAIVTPPDRYELGQWIKWAKKSEKPVLDPYLATAVAEETAAPILIAIDAEDMVGGHELRQAVDRSALLSGRSQDERDAVVQLLAKLMGIRFTVHFDDTITAVGRFDFAIDVGPEGKYVPAFIAEALEAKGAQIKELAGAEVAVSGKQVTLRCKLSVEALKHLLSVISPPLPERPEPKPASATATRPQQAELEAQATLRYFHSVQSILKELQKKSQKDTDYAKTALWHESYAKRIAQLPARNVNEHMLGFGAQISSYLGGLADSLRGESTHLVGLDRGAIAIWTNRYMATNIPEIRLREAEVVAKGVEDRQKIWRQIEQDEIQIRQKMYDKYHTSF